jgi:hypothetical protein
MSGTVVREASRGRGKRRRPGARSAAAVWHLTSELWEELLARPGDDPLSHR